MSDSSTRSGPSGSTGWPRSSRAAGGSPSPPSWWSATATARSAWATARPRRPAWPCRRASRRPARTSSRCPWPARPSPTRSSGRAGPAGSCSSRPPRAPGSSPAAPPGPSWRWPASTTSWPSRSGSSNGINVAHATIAGLQGPARPDEVAALRGKQPDEVTPAGVLRAYRERQPGDRPVRGGALTMAAATPAAKAAGDPRRAASRVTQVRSAIGTKPKHRGTLRALGLRGHRPVQRPARPPRDPGHDRPGPPLWSRSRRSPTVKLARAHAAPRARPGPSAGSAGASPARAARPPAGAPRARGPGTHPAGLRGWPAAPDAAASPSCRGFKNPFRVEYTAVNLDDLSGPRGRRGHPRHPGGGRPGPQGRLVKVLGRGELHPVRPGLGPRLLGLGRGGHRGGRRHASRSLPLPFGHGRPPARGNALTNR